MIICLGRISQCTSCSLPGTKARRAASSSLLGLAPDGGCLATDVTTRAGGLLHHLFTITARTLSHAGGYLFLWPDPAGNGWVAAAPAPDVIRQRALWSADFPRSP